MDRAIILGYSGPETGSPAGVHVAYTGKHPCQRGLVSSICCTQALIERHMLTAEEEQELLAGLSFLPEERWLQLLYRCPQMNLGS